jgi:uncharacterized membrane protein
MESRIKVLGHGAHPLLVTVPLGALTFSVASDALHTLRGDRRYADAARQALDFGLVTALVAAPFGTIDWFAIPSTTRAKRVGLWHGLGNLAVLGVFAASRALRARRSDDVRAKWLSAGGYLLAGVTAWLGAELVERHRIGVQDDAHENASSSLSRTDEPPTLPGFRSELGVEGGTKYRAVRR